jgi:nitrate reductase gamma subunit
MFETARIVVFISIVWAIIALIVQAIIARGHGRVEYSKKAGSVSQGIIYNFTWAMLPSHKETISKHPIKFTIGVLMHVGIFITIAKVLILLINPRIPPSGSIAIGFFLGLASVCALYLFLRRVFSRELHSMSSPDDYISILLALGFMVMGIAHEFSLAGPGAFLIFAAILFFYLPVGKLKHALFFFIARADYGARLGYRGTYPAKTGSRE